MIYNTKYIEMLNVYAISSGTYNGVNLVIHVIAKMNKL